MLTNCCSMPPPSSDFRPPTLGSDGEPLSQREDPKDEAGSLRLGPSSTTQGRPRIPSERAREAARRQLGQPSPRHPYLVRRVLRFSWPSTSVDPEARQDRGGCRG